MTTQSAAEPEIAPSYVATSQIPSLPTGLGPVLGNAADAWTKLHPWLAEEREHFIVFYLNVRHRLIGEPYILSIGSISGVEVHPREVFREAIVRGASAVIFAHNHPSGDVTPSRQDTELTSRLRQVGELCGISVLDHLVFSAGGWLSMSERGWL
jgi:DNA repair protein RadC